MNLITVITAQAALYSSELLTAWGVTGATTIAIAQAAALTLLVVAAIIAVVAVVAALYYCAQKVASAFKAKAPAPEAPADQQFPLSGQTLIDTDKIIFSHP